MTYDRKAVRSLAIVSAASAVLACIPGGIVFLGVVRGAGLTSFVLAVCVGAVLWLVGWLAFVGFRVKEVERALEEAEFSAEPGVIAELTESRRGIVAAFEIERRRIERDLHDGAQQYLVTASMDVGEALLVLDSVLAAVPSADTRLVEARRLLTKAQEDADGALRALRATVAGIHPKVLSDLGLEAAVRGLCADSPVECDVRIPHVLPEIPEGVIAAGYFLVSEALTNIAKHAPGARASVLLAADQLLHISVVDDGPGGAVVTPGGGLNGMKERLAAFGGTLTVTSPPGGPTTLAARIPLLLRRGEFGVVQHRKEDE